MTSQENNDLDALKRSIHQSKAKRAQTELSENKIVEGARLWDMARKWTLGAIASENPGWSEQQVREEFRRRIALGRTREERDIYRPVGPIQIEGEAVD